MKSKIEYLGFAYDIDNINVNFMINDTKKNLYLDSKGVEDILIFMNCQSSNEEEILDNYFETMKDEIFA